MNEDRLDLSPLDMAADPAKLDALVTAIHVRAAPELARRAGRGSVFGVLGLWARPMLAAAAIIAAVSGGALALVHPHAAWVPVVQALQVTEPVPEWFTEGRTADTQDLIVALEAGSR
jgi:anti-sigma-K factor RskA